MLYEVITLMPESSPLPQSGVALLAMLILVLVIVLTLGSIFYRHQLDVAQAIRMAHGDQAAS